MAVATTRDEGNTVRAGRERPAGPDSGSASRPRKALTIGAVAKILSQEFDDISISKIRYLEDQKLLSPRRTQGGYRLYSQTDVERLRAILRMQRDEFLPLRVIRQELATGDFTGSRRGSEAAATRRAASVEAPVSMLTPEELLDQAGVSGGAPARASGVRHRPARSPRWKIGLRRDRPRDRPRRGGAVAVRRRRPQSARLRQLGGPRGGAAPAARRPGTAIAQSGPPQGGDREPGEPGGGLRASRSISCSYETSAASRAEGAAEASPGGVPLDATGFTKAVDRRAA